jgi:hypothetical protein
MLSGCASKPSGPVWNVSELVGKPIDAVKGQIGPPQSETTPSGGEAQSSWKRDGATLTATWRTANKRVREWTLVSREDDRALREEERTPLLRAGQLQENDPRYSLDWIESGQRPLFYTGVRVVPALKNHAVVLRMSGGAALMQISYATTGAEAKSDSFLTIAPWEQALTLPDDTQITLNTSLSKVLSPGPTTFKIEIVVDGKVADSATSAGAPIQCQTEL